MSDLEVPTERTPVCGEFPFMQQWEEMGLDEVELLIIELYDLNRKLHTA